MTEARWSIEQGKLRQETADGRAVTLSGEMTYRLYMLLDAHKDAILATFTQEKQTHLQESIMVDTRDDSMLGESGPQKGATSSISIDSGLRQHVPGTIHPSRGS